MRLHDRIRSEEDGVAAVEFSIVSIFLITLMYGILMYGFIFGVDLSITHAAAEGARSAVSQPTAALQEQHAKDTALARLGWMGSRITAADITAIVATCPPPDNAYNCITVTVDYPWQARPMIPPILNIGVPDKIHAESTVQVD